jgi:hypothetical protein
LKRQSGNIRGVVKLLRSTLPVNPRPAFYKLYPRHPSKMTILSNHRVHSYKFTARAHRDITPKKLAIQTTKNIKKTRSVSPNKFNDLMVLLTTTTNDFVDTPITPPSTPILNAYDDFEDVDYTYDPTEDDVEEMWAHYDYLEWLCD